MASLRDVKTRFIFQGGSDYAVALASYIENLEHGLAFYKRRCDALQACQWDMRDPERVMVCDILANGALLHSPGKRYALPQPPDPPPQPRGESQ